MIRRKFNNLCFLPVIGMSMNIIRDVNVHEESGGFVAHKKRTR
jgi:hypothetical protein